MKILFDKLIKESGENLTKRQLAREMTKQGLFSNIRSAENLIQHHQRGQMKSVDWELLKYLCKRFNKQGAEIIHWDS
jgi:hypothetical protein